MIDDNTPHALLERAANTDFGIVVSAGNDFDARRLRRRLYSARQKLNADERLAGLSVLLRPGGEVWIVKRDWIVRPPNPDYASRPIAVGELPSSPIRARGRSRATFLRIP